MRYGALALIAAALVISLLGWDAGDRSPTQDSRWDSASTTTHPQPIEASVAARSQTFESKEPQQAQPALPAQRPEHTLVDALLQADRRARGPEVLEARRLLEQILRRYPNLAPVLARAAARLRNRELAFQLARVLARRWERPGVRAALLAQVRDGHPVPREAAIHACLGTRDPEVAGVVAEAFLDRDAPSHTLEAAALALADGVTLLQQPTRLLVRERARELAGRVGVPTSVRAGVLDLLDPKLDHALLSSLLEADAPRGLRLAAARRLLSGGAPREPVLLALGDLSREDPQLATALRGLLR